MFGLRGELKIAPSRIGADVLAAGVAVRATLRDGSTRALRVASLRLHQGRPLIRFAGFNDATEVAMLVGATLAVDRADVVLAHNEYLDDDLIGCTLIDTAGRPLGAVVAVEHYPAQDVLLVGPRRMMVPLVRAFIKAVDVATRRITVDLPPGLLDDDEAEEA